MTQSNQINTTRERLLKEAEILFAEKGYDAVSVREITNAANCNLAAVNYHFGNKKNLYLDVFRLQWLSRARRVHDSFVKNLAERDDGALPTGIIQALAKAFIDGPLTDEERLRHVQLIIREMTKPTEASEVVVGEVMRPFSEELGQLLQPHLNGEMDHVSLMLHILSIMAMVFHFSFARIPIKRITGCTYDQEFKDRLVKHIVNFSLTGLNVKEEVR